MSYPKTLQEAIVYFSDRQRAHDFLVNLRWPHGKVTCPRCVSPMVTWMQSVQRWKCREGHDRPQFSIKVGTIFEDSPLGLDKWLARIAHQGG